MLLTSPRRGSPMTRPTTGGLGRRGGARLGEHQLGRTTGKSVPGGRSATIGPGTNQAPSRDWKKADVAEAEGRGRVAGDRARKEGVDRRICLQRPMRGLHTAPGPQQALKKW